MRRTVAAYNLSRIPGQVYLLLAVIIFAAANSVTRKLTEIGSQNFIDGRNSSHFAMFYLWKYLRVAGLAYNLLATVEHLFLPAVFSKGLGQYGSSGYYPGALAPGVIFQAFRRRLTIVLVGRIESPHPGFIHLATRRTNEWLGSYRRDCLVYRSRRNGSTSGLMGYKRSSRFRHRLVRF